VKVLFCGFDFAGVAVPDQEPRVYRHALCQPRSSTRTRAHIDGAPFASHSHEDLDSPSPRQELRTLRGEHGHDLGLGG
jgi:hypothetical protein